MIGVVDSGNDPGKCFLDVGLFAPASLRRFAIRRLVGVAVIAAKGCAVLLME